MPSSYLLYFFVRRAILNPARQTLEEREERDRVAAEEAAAARVSQEAGAGEGEAGSSLRSAAFSKKRVKGGRSLARAPGETGSHVPAYVSITWT